MLITTCTQCLARFRVTPQQLNAKQGQVRCGKCRQVLYEFGGPDLVVNGQSATGVEGPQVA